LLGTGAAGVWARATPADIANVVRPRPAVRLADFIIETDFIFFDS
jgi:hypothetical protein